MTQHLNTSLTEACPPVSPSHLSHIQAPNFLSVLTIPWFAPPKSSPSLFRRLLTPRLRSLPENN
ncbi:hypothetical protein E2C01_064165 [Portunus trituberculatus]|uniref:Uncharacterized protein n=1 Tax=Portunus trituberculatus TaxID=210409 RepID=A0A5B7HFJ1_PORTR|nr:hypothetical protein [Portunus trituberculatus]